MQATHNVLPIPHMLVCGALKKGGNNKNASVALEEGCLLTPAMNKLGCLSVKAHHSPHLLQSTSTANNDFMGSTKRQQNKCFSQTTHKQFPTSNFIVSCIHKTNKRCDIFANGVITDGKCFTLTLFLSSIWSAITHLPHLTAPWTWHGNAQHWQPETFNPKQMQSPNNTLSNHVENSNGKSKHCCQKSRHKPCTHSTHAHCQKMRCTSRNGQSDCFGISSLAVLAQLTPLQRQTGHKGSSAIQNHHFNF